MPVRELVAGLLRSVPELAVHRVQEEQPTRVARPARAISGRCPARRRGKSGGGAVTSGSGEGHGYG